MIDERKLSEVLRDFARTMVADGPTREVAERLVHRMAEVLPVAGAGLSMRVRSTDAYEIVASNELARRYEELQREMNLGPGVLAEQTGAAVLVNDLHGDGRFDPFAAATQSDELAAVFAFPLRRDVDHLGSINLYCNSTGDLDPTDLTIAQTLADVAASYLILAAARDDALATAAALAQLSLRDPLTGLANRQLLDDRIAHAAEHAQRNQTGTAILFVDLDQFKLVNDAHGHAVGDAVLTAIAQRLSASLRSSDTLARISGDEFVFLCEDLTGPDDVDVIAQRVADAFSEPFEAAGRSLHLNASIGSAYAAAGADISSELLGDADAAMYRAKRSRCVP